ncbi:thioesterase domain-containing protein [Nocardia sp. CA-129566]|uniref:thioesterase domain-containing protein n=1 Tax=Nocardia sp. CA-129566 TaxID=3239976 RepID=UPI003D98F503
MNGPVVVFPGQGAQRTGMGVDFCAEFPLARAVFTEASEAVGEDLFAVCRDRDPRLHLTEYTQPSVLTMEIAVYRVLITETGLAPVGFAGHSLGEYTALVAAGALELADAVRLVRARGALMQRAVPEGEGSMAALIRPDIAATGIGDLVAAAGVEIANDNSPDQLVVSGRADDVAALRETLARRLPDLRFVPLRVSAPFHSRLMRPIEAQFAARLAECAPRIRSAHAVTVVSNYTGDFHRPETVADHLVRQISAPVRWTDTMKVLTRTTADIYEIGPSAPLSKFFAALGHQVSAVSTVRQLREVAARHPATAHTTAGRPRTLAAHQPVAAHGPAETRVTQRTAVAGELALYRRAAGPPRMRLFCWPFAGGRATVYGEWRSLLPDWVEVCVAELPARQPFRAQEPIRGFGDLVESALAQVLPLTDLPFAFFGHSLGALTAYEVACRLPDGAAPAALFLGAAAAPHLPRPPRLSGLSDDDFRTAIGHYGGIPPEVWDAPEVMALFLPALRGDFEIFDDYRFTPRQPPRCPVHLYGGRADRQVATSQLEAWRDVLPRVLSTELFPGGHFFLTDQRDAVVASIADKLDALRPDAASIR